MNCEKVEQVLLAGVTLLSMLTGVLCAIKCDPEACLVKTVTIEAPTQNDCQAKAGKKLEESTPADTCAVWTLKGSREVKTDPLLDVDIDIYITNKTLADLTNENYKTEARKLMGDVELDFAADAADATGQVKDYMIPNTCRDGDSSQGALPCDGTGQKLLFVLEKEDKIVGFAEKELGLNCTDVSTECSGATALSSPAAHSLLLLLAALVIPARLAAARMEME